MQLYKANQKLLYGLQRLFKGPPCIYRMEEGKTVDSIVFATVQNMIKENATHIQYWK